MNIIQYIIEFENEKKTVQQLFHWKMCYQFFNMGLFFKVHPIKLAAKTIWANQPKFIVPLSPSPTLSLWVCIYNISSSTLNRSTLPLRPQIKPNPETQKWATPPPPQRDNSETGRSSLRSPRSRYSRGWAPLTSWRALRRFAGTGAKSIRTTLGFGAPSTWEMMVIFHTTWRLCAASLPRRWSLLRWARRY